MMRLHLEHIVVVVVTILTFWRGTASGQEVVNPSSKKSTIIVPTMDRFDITADMLMRLRKNANDLKSDTNLEFPIHTNAGSKEGLPESVLKYVAQQSSARKQRTITAAQVLEFAHDDLSRYKVSTLEGPFGGLSPEAIIITDADKRPALLTCKARIAESIPTLWYKKLTQPGTKKCVQTVLSSVGLVTYQDFDGLDVPVGTGWVIAPGIVITNRHVALTFAPAGKIMKNPVTDKPIEVTINFSREWCGAPDSEFRVTDVLHIVPEPGPDVAILRAELKNTAGQTLPQPLKVVGARPFMNPKDLVAKTVFIAGFPFQDSRNPADAQKKVFADIYGVKRCAPGTLVNDSGKGPTDMLFHDCSTLGGNSGSPVVALTEDETPIVWGLHFQGSYKDRNWAWPLWKIVEVDQIKKILDNSK